MNADRITKAVGGPILARLKADHDRQMAQLQEQLGTISKAIEAGQAADRARVLSQGRGPRTADITKAAKPDVAHYRQQAARFDLDPAVREGYRLLAEQVEGRR